jgi:hypothetical protein
MDSHLVELVLSKRFRQTSPEAIKVYLALRTEILAKDTATTRLYRNEKEFVAGASVQLIAQTCGFSDLAVRRVLDELVLKGWIQSKRIGRGDVLYLLGDFKNGYADWCVDRKLSESGESTKQVSGEHGVGGTGGDAENMSNTLHPGVQDLLEKATGNDKKVLDEAEARRKGRKKTNPKSVQESRKVRVLATIGLIAKPEEARRFIAARWKELHEDKFHCDPIGFRPKDVTKTAFHAMNRKITAWCIALWKQTGSEVLVEEYFEYVLENWSELRTKVFPGFDDVIPSLAFIANDRVFRQIRGCMVGGIPDKAVVAQPRENMQNRAAATDWKSETDGW